jgi:hypothetical protein
MKKSFKFVYIPCDTAEPIQELTQEYTEGVSCYLLCARCCTESRRERHSQQPSACLEALSHLIFPPPPPPPPLPSSPISIHIGVDDIECLLTRLQNHFRAHAKTAAQREAHKAELMKKVPEGGHVDMSVLDIAADMQLAESVALLTNTRETGYLGVNLYCDDSGVLKGLPTNVRASQFAQTVGECRRAGGRWGPPNFNRD